MVSSILVRRLLLVSVLTAFGPTMVAADLATIERGIAKEPVYSGKPAYALLVFGREAATRVWIVQDGAVLYVDRNGNGDLTEAGECVEAKKGLPFAHDAFEFDVGTLRDGPLRHERVVVTVMPLAGGRGEAVKELLARAPDAIGLGVTMNVQSDRLGSPLIPSRFVQMTSGVDPNGVLQMADGPAAAPVLHFNGPFRVQGAPWDWKNEFTPGRPREIIAVLATPGVGPGATVVSGYEGLLPPEAHPQLTCVFASKGNGATPRLTYDLKERCCTSQLYGNITAPADLSVSVAEVTWTMKGWEAEEIASTSSSLRVTSPPALVDEPVSKRLKSTLVHAPRTGVIWQVRFSPDGRKIMGSSIITNAVEVWDVASSRSLVQIEIGKGYQATLLESAPSPDWQTLFSYTRRRKGTPIEQDGKAMMRWEMEGAIHEWDLVTGERLHSTVLEPARSILQMSISPDGSSLLLGCERSGVTEQYARNVELSLFDTRSRMVRTVEGPYGVIGEYSPDGTHLLATAKKSEWHSTALHSISVTDGQVITKAELPGDFTTVAEAHFSPDGRQLAAALIDYPKPSEMKGLRIILFDATNGKVQASREIETGPASLYQLTYSQNGKSLMVAWKTGPSFDEGRFAVLNTADGLVGWSRKFHGKEFVRGAAFRPDNQLLALGTQVVPENKFDLDPRDLPQARIQLVDTITGEVFENLIAPRGVLMPIAFSPDGETLATGSTGAVHLWDVSESRSAVP